MMEYYISTGLLDTHKKEFDSDEDAWNELSQILCGVRSPDDNLIGTLYRVERLAMENTNFTEEENKELGRIYCNWSGSRRVHIPVFFGYMRKRYDGAYHSSAPSANEEGN